MKIGWIIEWYVTLSEMHLLLLKNQRSSSDFKVIAHVKAFFLVPEVSFHILHLLLTIVPAILCTDLHFDIDD